MYTSWVIKNTNKDKFMVVHRECLSDALWAVKETYAEAYSLAKAMGCGREPVDETRHH